MKKNRKDRILQNIFSQTFGKSLSYLINFLAITIAARFLGVESFGIFSSVIAIITIISKIIDFGISPIIFRETSRSELDHSFFSAGVALRSILYIAALLAFNVISFFTNYLGLEYVLINILFLNIFISSRFMFIRELIEIFFKIELKMRIVMFVNLLDNVIFLILILLLPTFKGDLIYVIWVYTISNLPGFILLLFITYKLFRIKLKIDSQKVKFILKESLPLFGFVIILALFNQLDILVLNYLDSPFSAGIYSAGFRLTMPLSILPIALVSTVMPYIYKKINVASVADYKIERITFKILFLISFFFFAIFLFKPTDFLILIFGKEYAEAAVPTVLLFASNIFLFCNYFSLDILTANGKQKFNFVYALIILFIDIGVLFLFIFSYSSLGAAIAKLTATLIGFFVLEVLFNKLYIKINFLSKRLFLFFILIVIIFYLVSYLNLYLYMGLSSLIYLYLSLKIGYINDDEVNFILKVLKKEDWKKILSKI